MPKHIVKCKICGQSFDLNKIQGVKCSSTRYAHLECFPNGEKVPMEIDEPKPKKENKKEIQKKKDTEDRKKLTDYIDKIFKKNVNWPMVMKQIKSYREEYSYTYSGMLKSLIYAYEIKKEDISKAIGVGIIPLCYKQAYDYYFNLWEISQKNTVSLSSYKAKEDIIKIPPPQRKIPKSNLFNFLDEEGS